MREKLLLSAFGLVMGALLIGVCYPFLKKLQISKTEKAGSHFSTVEELQRAMLERDERDNKSDGSVSLRSLIMPHPSPLVIYDLAPHLNLKFMGEPVITNSCGMRSPERAVSKDPNTIRIAVLGDSFTFGWGVREDQAFPSLIESNLNKFTTGDPKVEVLNFGVPGYSTFQEVALFEDKGLDFKPDIVLVFFIDNDFGLPFFVQGVAADNVSNRAVQLKSSASAGNGSNRFPDPNTSLKKLAEMSERYGFKLFVAINPNKSAKKISKRLWVIHGNPLIHHIRLRDRMLERIKSENIDPKTLSLPSDPHPSPLKHRILAELISQNLLPELRF